MAYIKQETVISELKNLPEQERIEYMGIYDCIKSIPAADVVEVVRCKDCIYCDPDNKHCDHPMGTTLPVSRKESDFCSYGVKKECSDNKPVTQFDRIKAMNIEELADVLYDTNDKICFENCNASTGNKFSCRFGENVDISECKNCIKKWLESEVTE